MKEEMMSMFTFISTFKFLKCSPVCQLLRSTSEMQPASFYIAYNGTHLKRDHIILIHLSGYLWICLIKPHEPIIMVKLHRQLFVDKIIDLSGSGLDE